MRRWLGGYAAVVLILLHAPLIVMALFAFNDARVMAWTGFSLRWYRALFDDARLGDAMRNTVLIGAGTTLVSVVLGTLAAFALVRGPRRGRRLLETLLLLPLMVPDVALGVALLMFFTALHVPLGRTTVIVAQSTFGISMATLVVAARLRSFDRNLELAARDLGAGPVRAFLLVTIPAILPGLLAAALITFTLSFDDFVVTWFTTGPGVSTVPLEIYGMVKRGVSPKINALSTLVTAVTLVVLLAAARLGRGLHGGDHR